MDGEALQTTTQCTCSRPDPWILGGHLTEASDAIRAAAGLLALSQQLDQLEHESGEKIAAQAGWNPHTRTETLRALSVLVDTAMNGVSRAAHASGWDAEAGDYSSG